MIVDWQVIPHSEQRYITAGDWYWAEDKSDDESSRERLFIRISETGSRGFSFLLGVHEFIEAMLCWFRDVKLVDVTAWDIYYEAHRKQKMTCGCSITEDSEAGDDPHAPYHREHVVASMCERLLAFFLGIDWSAYERAVEAL